MPRYKVAAVARHQFLLSQFKVIPLEGTRRHELRFCGELPRAEKFQDAVNAAMAAAGKPIGEGAVEISQDLANRIKYLQSLFVGSSPQASLVTGEGGAVFPCVTYLYAMKRFFWVSANATIDDVLDKGCHDHDKASPIAGVRSSREEIYMLMHSALRKASDSTVTSALWNAMHVLGPDARNWLATLVSTALSEQEFETDEQVLSAVKEAFKADLEYVGDAERILVSCLVKMFTDSDWRGLLSYCIIWPFEVKAQEAEAA